MESLIGCRWEVQGVTLAPLPMALNLGVPHLQEELAATEHSSAEGTQRPRGHLDWGIQWLWGYRDGHTGKSENGTKERGIRSPFGV